ncbi:hypothetical protein [Chitinophaga sp. XS-30]|uniref:hypothetical protein n=1 Tax=Chitinophaga sp. XS-30 TaxID=2604421 RepID=UPI0011DDD598|nr:hypothetical protein [Chitinophaga sp. XS-30]QEH42151.1 hypothetical protein FW415_15240 [Chitinophaga sp. XS-30]
MYDLNKISAVSAFFFTLLFFLIIVFRQKRCDRSDLGSFATVFLAGSNIPAGIFLCWYVFDPDPAAIISQTRLAGFERYFSFAGSALLFLSIAGIWTSIKTAFKGENTAPPGK